jgi:hypothetical protein
MQLHLGWRAIGKITILQVVVAGACFLGVCSFDLYRIAHLDPVIELGRLPSRKCILPGDPEYSTPSGYYFRCDPSSIQEMADWRHHPIAYVVGTLFPTIILTPAAYWLTGFLIRRRLKAKKRFKVCEFCTERIKSEAKVCRYCGRDIAGVALGQAIT